VGLRDVTDAPIGPLGFRSPQPFYYLVLAFCVLAVFVSWRLANSRIGRGWNAMREDELAAEVTGVSSVTYKLLAFAMGAGVGCLSGALFAVKIGSLAPTSFDILVSITADPKVILMDEPSMGLAPVLVDQVFEIIQDINRGGVTIFVVEQNANMALSIADRGYVLQTGQIVLADTAAALLENPQMREAYLGELT
jgi:ABC-type cobalamin transport system ATPase subunit